MATGAGRTARQGTQKKTAPLAMPHRYSLRSDASGSGGRKFFAEEFSAARAALKPVFRSGPFVLWAAHHHESRDRPDLRQDAQNIGVPVFVSGQIQGFDPQQVFHGAGDVVTFPHLGRAGHRALERLLCRLGMGVQANCDTGDKADAQLFAVKNGPVALDHPGPLRRLNPAQASRGRQARTFSQG